MSDFSSILSSMNGQARPPQQSTNTQRPKIPGQRPTSFANGEKLTTSNTVAGVKRKSEEPQSDPRAKAARTESNDGLRSKPAAAPQNRFQLSGKPGTQPRPNGMPHHPASSPTTASNGQKPGPQPVSGTNATASFSAVPAKRGFASIMQKAKAAQEAAKATGPSGIKHKSVEKLTKRERRKMEEEAAAQKQAEKERQKADVRSSKNGDKQAGGHKAPETNYKGTMRKPAEPLSYKGTMRAAAPGEMRDQKKKKGQAQDKYGGYASWSDLSDAEDEEEDYDSDGSSDMEGGFDDVEREEMSATRAAKKEDQEALEEEERLKREKLDRKRKLLELSKNAASRKKY